MVTGRASANALYADRLTPAERLTQVGQGQLPLGPQPRDLLADGLLHPHPIPYGRTRHSNSGSDNFATGLKVLPTTFNVNI